MPGLGATTGPQRLPRAVPQSRGRGVPVEPDKSGDTVAAKLQPFRCTLTADAEHRFNAVYASGHIVEAGCNAHGRRKFRDAEATRPDLAAEGGGFLAAMYVDPVWCQNPIGILPDEDAVVTNLDLAPSAESTTSSSHYQGYYQPVPPSTLAGAPSRATRLVASKESGTRHQLRRLAMVEAQQPTEAFSPRHRRVVVRGCSGWCEQPVLAPLVIAL